MKANICLSFLLYLTLTLTLMGKNLYAEKSLQVLTHDLSIDGVRISLHYYEEQSHIAEKVIDIMHVSFSKIHEYFNYKPKSRVHFSLSDQSQFANGLASVFPQNTVVLNNFPPTGHGLLSFSKDWIKVLVVHEYIHIVTLEMTQGFLGVARFLFGSTAKLAGIIPKWLSEGVATWGESEFSNEGRLRNPWAKKLLEQMILDPKACHKISCMDYFEVSPYGNSSYIFGAFFLDYLETRKSHTISCIFQENSKRLPFFLSGVFKKCTGQSAQDALDQFIKQVTDNVAGKVGSSTPQSLLSKVPGYWLQDHGTLENDKFLIAVFNLNDNAYSESKREKALAIFLKGKKIRLFRLKYDLEKIYWHSYKDQLLALTFLKNSQREHYIYRLTPDGFIKEQRQIKGGVYQIQSESVNGRGVNNIQEINYSHSSWSRLKPLEQLNQNFLNKSQELSSEQIKLDAQRVTLENKKYHGLQYWRLNYLSFLASFSGELFFSQINTKLSDPLEHHALDLALDFYQDVSDTSPITGSAFYTYSKIRNWQLSLGYSQSLSRSVGFIQTNKYESYIASISHKFANMRVFNQSILFSASRVLESDFLSSETRENTVARLRWDLDYGARKIRALVQSFSLSLAPSFTRVENLDAQFWGARVSIATQLRLAKYFYSSLRVKYGKLFKQTNVDGALYLGGANSTLTGQYPFSAYAIGFQGGFGNEVLSSRAQLKLNIGRPGWGFGFFPLRWNDWSLLGGAEFLKADFLQDGVNRKLNSQLTSVYAGVEMNFSLAYNFPLTMKLIISKTQDDILDNQQFLLLLDTPLLP